MIEQRAGLTAIRDLTHSLLDTHKPPNLLIIPGSGLRSDPHSRLGARVSWDTELRLLAASNYWEELAKQGHRPEIILSGGKVYPGFMPLARYAEDHLQQINPNLPITKIEATTNTLEDIRHAAKYMQRAGLNNGVVISNRHHLTAEVIALQHGFSFVPAELLIRQTDPTLREFITKLEASSAIQQLRRQQLARAAMLLLPGGSIPYDLLSHITLRQRAIITPYDPNELRNIALST